MLCALSYCIAEIANIRKNPVFAQFAAVDQLQSGEWHSHRNWKSIFATERAKGQQQADGYVQPSHNHIPLFEEMCRLLYRTHPDELLTFVTFAQLARDYQALQDSAFARKCRKEFFYHRALLALPAIVSPSLTPVLPEAIRVHSQLLLCRYLFFYEDDFFLLF